ncbi:MAG: hypothetical protein HGJ94_11355 [Desulfosarcina sp.]|nr:hypothetical protein [Desulfosarcina sp.]MBC2743192.1 hypothetical protein [Desulfosarcina sp.]MBC2766103.1 hypothetical protein [Desulfosarcina sp.]
MRTLFTENGDCDGAALSEASVFSVLSPCSAFLDVVDLLAVVTKHTD